MLGRCTRVEDIWRTKEVNYKCLLGGFSSVRSLFVKDGLHLKRAGTAHLGRILKEDIKQVFRKFKLISGNIHT